MSALTSPSVVRVSDIPRRRVAPTRSYQRAEPKEGLVPRRAAGSRPPWETTVMQEGPVGFEPTARGLKVPCSTAELRAHVGRRSSAGPTEYCPGEQEPRYGRRATESLLRAPTCRHGSSDDRRRSGAPVPRDRRGRRPDGSRLPLPRGDTWPGGRAAACPARVDTTTRQSTRRHRVCLVDPPRDPGRGDARRV